MRLKSLCFALLCSLTYLFSFAASVPAAPIIQPSYSDTILLIASLPAATLSEGKKVGFFAKLKNKLFASISKKYQNDDSRTKTKRIVGWTALGLVLSGILLPILGVAGAIWLVPIGFVAGIVALSLRGGVDEITRKKKGNTAAKIAIALTAGLGIALLIFLATWDGIW